MQRRRFFKQSLAGATGLVTLPVAPTLADVSDKAAIHDEHRRAEALLRRYPLAEQLDNPVKLIELRISWWLIRLCLEGSDRITPGVARVRRKLSQRGIQLPLIHVRDFSYLRTYEYNYLVRGRKVAGGILAPKSIYGWHKAPQAKIDRAFAALMASLEWTATRFADALHLDPQERGVAT